MGSSDTTIAQGLAALGRPVLGLIEASRAVKHTEIEKEAMDFLTDETVEHTVHLQLGLLRRPRASSPRHPLRTREGHARDALMHFKDDRLARDMLEPAARRVDDLMNMFVSTAPDSAQGYRWVTEIQSGIEQVTNPKAADALREARVDITALLRVMGSEGTQTRSGFH